jgi:hypothetical protein
MHESYVIIKLGSSVSPSGIVFLNQKSLNPKRLRLVSVFIF